jgi:CHAT domain-containing protein
MAMQNLQTSAVNRGKEVHSELKFINQDTTLRGTNWYPLKATEYEIKTIQNLLIKSGQKAKVLSKFTGTEESFKNISVLSKSPKLIHLATHGYFFPDSRAINKNSLISPGADVNGSVKKQESVFQASEHPMLRSGLIMSNGNQGWKGKIQEGAEDGILTAYEISQMDLSNTELVVLSACETGLGDIKGNEGVYGLQRAFKIAGAKYIIMSLWQVPDKQTSQLMIAFYKNWLNKKMSIPRAFHAAQKELRKAGLDPYQWAGFVLVE